MAPENLYKTMLTLEVGPDKIERPVHKELFMFKSEAIAEHCKLAEPYENVKLRLEKKIKELEHLPSAVRSDAGVAGTSQSPNNRIITALSTLWWIDAWLMEPLTSAWVSVGQLVGIPDHFSRLCYASNKYEPLRGEIRRILREKDGKEELVELDYLVRETLADLKCRLDKFQQTSFNKAGRMGEAERQCYHINDTNIGIVDMLIYAAYNNNKIKSSPAAVPTYIELVQLLKLSESLNMPYVSRAVIEAMKTTASFRFVKQTMELPKATVEKLRRSVSGEKPATAYTVVDLSSEPEVVEVDENTSDGQNTSNNE